MAIFSDEFRALKGQSLDSLTWSARLLGDDPRDAEVRMELAIRIMAPPVAHGILRYLGSVRLNEVLEGLALFWAVCSAGMSGWNAVRLGETAEVVVERDGVEALVVPVAVNFSDGRIPQSAMIDRLVHQLESVIFGRRFVLHLKQDLPPSFDPLVLVQPVQNWVQEIDRGQWSGGYAIYHEGDVALELCLLDEVPEEGTGQMLFHVPPLMTENVLRYIRFLKWSLRPNAPKIEI